MPSHDPRFFARHPATGGDFLPIVYGVKVGDPGNPPSIKEKQPVTNLTIKLPAYAVAHACGLCGQRTAPSSGPSLCLTESQDAVCLECGKQHAPELAALVDLARVAQRVGRINRHTLVPSFNELLDLARAAENYSHSAVPALRKAS